MKTKRYDMIVIGAGPAGLSAAIEAARQGVRPIVFDENARPASYSNRSINFLDQRNTGQRSGGSRSVRSSWPKRRNTA